MSRFDNYLIYLSYDKNKYQILKVSNYCVN